MSDNDAEALIAGCSVEGVPPELGDMLSTMRTQATVGPGVPISGALTEFMVERTASVTPIGAAPSKARPRGSRRIAKKAAAAFAIVPAKMLIGATMAAAAVGGAQAFGLVDVPLLPGPEPVVVTSVPAETVPPTTVTVAATLATTTTAPSATTVASSSASTGTTESGATVLGQPPASVPTVASPPTVPTPEAEDGTTGCDFGQETSGRQDGESNADVPDQRPDVAANSVDPPIDPCTRGGADQTRPSVPAEPSRGAGAPSSVPGNTGGGPAGGGPGQDSGDNSGSGSGNSNGAPSGRAPGSEQSGNGNARGASASTTSPPRNPGQGRTPPGD